MAGVKSNYTEVYGFAMALGKRGIYHPMNRLTPDDCPKVGEFIWIARQDGNVDCLVLGIMLFTWEQGIAED